VDGAAITTLRDDGVGCVLALFELGGASPRHWTLGGRLESRCPAVWRDRTSLLLHPVGGADLYQFRFRGTNADDLST
jgi:hypothetical protein